MTAKVTEYTVCAAVMNSKSKPSREIVATDLAKRVEAAMRLGFRPHGDMVAVQCGYETFLYQPMVKFSD